MAIDYWSTDDGKAMANSLQQPERQFTFPKKIRIFGEGPFEAVEDIDFNIAYYKGDEVCIIRYENRDSYELSISDVDGEPDLALENALYNL